MNPGDILVIASLLVSITVLFFIIWDHIKDDRILAREVQDFYNDIEMLIFTNLQVKYYELLQKAKVDVEDQEVKALNKNKNRDIIQKNYLNTKIRQNFKLYAQYLGLTYNEENSAYLNGTIYLLKNDGSLLKRNIEFNTEEPLINIFTEIKQEQISELKLYLNSLRFYWKKKYSKFIFRPQLDQIVNFDDLLGYVKPLNQKKQKYLSRIGRKGSKAS